jgi:hypothetical protein
MPLALNGKQSHYTTLVMKNFPNTFSILLTSATIIAIASIFIYAFHSVRSGQGLVHYFARLGIELDYTAIIVALGLIPVFWLVAFIVKTVTLRWK